MTEKHIYIDVWNPMENRVDVVQGEVSARYVVAHIHNSGVPLNLDGASVQVYGTKPDGTGILNDCEVVDATRGQVSIPMTQQMSVAPGEYEDAGLQIIRDGKILKVLGLSIVVHPAYDYDEDVSEDELSALQEAIDRSNYAASRVPSIGKNGNWYLGDEDTGESSRGKDGVRGRGLLKVSTAPTEESSTVDGYSYKYKFLLSKVLSESGASEVLVGDIIKYSYYEYGIGYVGANYAFAYTRTSIRGAMGRCPERLYVEDYKTDDNTWNDAFAALFADCLSAGSIACTGSPYYALTAPLYIGNIDVDFENCELYNNVPEGETNLACVVLTGAEKKIHKFGTVTGRQSIGILINTANGTYKFNRVYAKLIQGYSHALHISTTNYTCCFNEFHVPLLKSCVNPLAVYCASTKTKWANECHFYLETIEGYRSTIPTMLISMTNISRCNVYNVDLECGDYIILNPNHTVAVELTNCKDVAFYNPRTKEPFNAVQFRFVGESFDNFIDSTYCKYRTIDSSKMIMSDVHYNVWRGRVSTENAGTTTNCDTLRIYKDMVVPENINSMVREVSENFTVSSSLINKTMEIIPGEVTHGGIPTLLKWLGGDITIDKRFIALLPTTIQIMRVTDAVGNILDTGGNVILAGSDLELNKRCDIRVNGATYAVITGEDEDHRKYPYFHDISLAIGDFVEEAPEEWVPPITITHEFIDGFVRTNGTINTTSTNYKHTGLVEYMGGSIDFRSVSESSGASNSAVAFFDENQTFLGNLETAVGGFDTFYSQYNTKEYATINGSDIGADIMAGTITAEQIAEWYPATAYIAVSCPIAASGIITTVYDAVENPCMAKQTY